MNRWSPLLYLSTLLVLVNCSPRSANVGDVPRAASAASRVSHGHHRTASSVIQHVVVVIQENRTVDDLFNGFCVNASTCADTVTVDPVSGTPLTETSLAAPYGISHSHKNFATQFDGGKMDGFPLTKSLCNNKQKNCPYSIFAYAPVSETQVYRQLATVDGEFSDRTFETNQGPSFPAHYYAIAGQSGGYDADHWAIMGGSGSCGTTHADVQINMSSPYPGQTGNKVLPCKDFQTIFDLVANAGHTWRYYTNTSAGFFSTPEAIAHLYNSPNIVIPSTNFLNDVASGTLADVTFVIPWSMSVSDHPAAVKDASAGPTWVASVVNAVGESQFWNNTAVVLWWDDWGGFFDHVTPPTAPVYPDPFEYSFRVPLMVISPYARVGNIDHTPRTFVSALRLIEETFNLPSLGTTDQYEPDGLDSMFNFDQAPVPYTPVGGSAANPRKYHPHRVQETVPIDADAE